MLQLNYRDSRPIYEQIKEQYRRLILNGVLAPDEKLPSVRELAAQLAINPNTIQRAYRELEAEGYLYSIPAKGSYVSPVLDLRRQKIEQAEAAFRQAADALRALGYDTAAMAALLEKEEENHD